MLCKVFCACCNGLEINTITVEVSVSDGIRFFLVGLPDSAVKESQQRIESTFACNGFRFPGKRITINLAPANIRKEGSLFDVALAIGILCASSQLPEPICARLSEFMILGELSLDGHLREIPGALPIIIHAKEEGFKGCILPTISAMEGAEIDGISVFGAETFSDVIQILLSPESAESKIVTPQSVIAVSNCTEEAQNYDFAQVKGQMQAKRGLEIAAAGGHNIILNGSPGSGKTFLSKCLNSILPPLSKDESIQTSKIYSVAGLLGTETKKENHYGGLLKHRPFRSPHHTITVPALIGGGAHGLPGEISLAHNGVLFCDEFAEYDRRAIEVMRQPLEDGIIQISRVKVKHVYPARFMLVATMNPCPCGLFYEKAGKCKCSSTEIIKYRRRISGPVMDRIDIQIIVRAVAPNELIATSATNTNGESSKKIAERVRTARHIQQQRYIRNNESFLTNAAITPSKLPTYCKLHKEEAVFMEAVINKLNISARGFTRVLKIARTIADLEGSQDINIAHLAEAVSLRCPEKDEMI